MSATASETGLDFGRFQKILKRFRKVSVSSRSAIDVSEYFRMFRKVSIRVPGSPTYGQELQVSYALNYVTNGPAGKNLVHIRNGTLAGILIGLLCGLC